MRAQSGELVTKRTRLVRGLPCPASVFELSVPVPATAQFSTHRVRITVKSNRPSYHYLLLPFSSTMVGGEAPRLGTFDFRAWGSLEGRGAHSTLLRSREQRGRDGKAKKKKKKGLPHKPINYPGAYFIAVGRH